MQKNIYADIAQRCNGDIYIGVVGPVRTGKSTFIKKFMENLVIPNIQNQYDRERCRDSVPQCGSGRTVMTTEPKFIPDEAVEISLEDNASFKVKMVDCVGFLVDEAIGDSENGTPRMVMTPWSNEAVPFELAAHMGTEKVIREHATIGILVTSDGTIGEISRESYEEAEIRAVEELKATKKPFALVINSANPESFAAKSLAMELEERYCVPVALVNCLELDAEDIKNILELILLEFPVCKIEIGLPSFFSALDSEHKIYKSVFDEVYACAKSISRVGEISSSFENMTQNEFIEKIDIEKIDLGSGEAFVSVSLNDGLFYDIINEYTGFSISDEGSLIGLLKELADVKKSYDKVAKALSDVNETGYGIVTPTVEDLTLDEPEIVKQGSSYGVKLRASAPSIHMIKANIQTEVSPTVGTQMQSEELLKSILREFEEEPKKIWETNMLGKPLYELVSEGLLTKLSHVPDDARVKLSNTLQRVINEGSGGLICIIL